VIGRAVPEIRFASAITEEESDPCSPSSGYANS
jgi:hypothetical protein